MTIDTTFLRRCISSLQYASSEIVTIDDRSSSLYDVYRAACVKEFELVLEQSGKLLRKRLAAYFASNRQADRLAFKDLFRYAAKHGLLDTEVVERWLLYRDNRNDTAHNYGEDFAESTLELLTTFVEDAKSLADMIDQTDER
ncbi:MAG: nucleotidyltransferase substrate binding protein [Aestuariivita sp.]|nr:nucleotidyltransferase substrate binding protein [Aestuariivita sp.]MCY4201621.1 nucleotidyltransferase substrate binding protein [Aestuariivita sp.]MCY4289043.1 nucleotidyltransferase substrate binding protein [Aestuariivita sp.]MCY4347228.1 nucleotidyltransferase substrate binding protein [Aestuariivita sp.]